MTARTSRNTVKKHIQKWNTPGMPCETFQQKSESELHDLFCVLEPPSSSPRMEEPDSLMPAICRESGKRGMTTLRQWDRYRESRPDGYGLSRFRIAVRRHRRITNPSMRMEHKAGDKMLVDCCGDKLWIYPSGESPRQADVFVSVPVCSLLTYAEAPHSQSGEDFITACENAFYCCGGVPRAIVPDSLKAAVAAAGCRESVLNEEYERFSEHCGVTVVPARVRKPEDRALIENAVKLTCKDIHTGIEPLHCPDLKSLSAAIRSAPEMHNHGTLTGWNYSRRTCFEDEVSDATGIPTSTLQRFESDEDARIGYQDMERDAPGALNPIRCRIKKQAGATAGKDGYIRLRDDAHCCSVPYTRTGRKPAVRYTASDAEVFDG